MSGFGKFRPIALDGRVKPAHGELEFQADEGEAVLEHNCHRYS